MKRPVLIFAVIAALLCSCGSETQIPDVGQDFTRHIEDARVCCHATSERFFFNFELLDSTLTVADTAKSESDIAKGDRVEFYFSPAKDMKKPYYCAEMDPKGHVLDYKALFYRQLDDSWNFSTLKLDTCLTPTGYRVGGSIALEELRSLGIDLENGFFMGVFYADYKPDGSVTWHSLVPMGEEEPDFHRPKMLFECRMTPKKERRGVVVYPKDITSLGLEEWSHRIDVSGINLIGIHAATFMTPLDSLEMFVKSQMGQDFLKLCADKNVDVEYELHALQTLLPRELFASRPELFRMDENGVRQQTYNMCFTSDEAMEAIRPVLKDILSWMHPTTHRYFFWTDDVTGAFCHCDKCSAYTPSEQALIFENKLLAMIREYDPQATLAHLAYHQTLAAPMAVSACDGVFLEYAPIKRDYSQALSEDDRHSLETNILAFPCHSTHILEYWLDESMFSSWKRDALVPLPFNREECARDVDLYRAEGASSITCFATWLDGSYVSKYGPADEAFEAYGKSF